MPESVTDRPTKAHEYVFLLSKQPRYFFDQEAVREKYQDGPGLNGGAYSPPGQSPHSNARGPDGRHKTSVLGQDGSIQHRDGERWPNGGRNIRSVWEIATQPYPEAHFATFPEELARRCIAAGTSERGKCPECGAPWVRELERKFYGNLRTADNKDGHADLERGITRNEFVGGKEYHEGYEPPKTIAWVPSCTCNATVVTHDCLPIPAVVLDPFMGSGTVAHVARKLGRRSVGIDLNESYLTLAAKRLQQLALDPELLPS